MIVSVEEKRKMCAFITNKLEKVNLKNLVLFSELPADLQLIADGLCDSIGAEWIEFGSTKMVISFSEYPNYVFKIPLRKDPYSGEEAEFCNANDFLPQELSDWDYCAAEAWLYERAYDEHVDSFFAETSFLLEYIDYELGPHPIYIAERYSNYDFKEIAATRGYNNRNIIDEMIDVSSLDMPIYLLNLLLETHSYESMSDFCHFCKKYHIDDLHSMNLGMQDSTDLSTIKIIDYSGFKD